MSACVKLVQVWWQCTRIRTLVSMLLRYQLGTHTFLLGSKWMLLSNSWHSAFSNVVSMHHAFDIWMAQWQFLWTKGLLLASRIIRIRMLFLFWLATRCACAVAFLSVCDAVHGFPCCSQLSWTDSCRPAATKSGSTLSPACYATTKTLFLPRS